MSSDVTTYLTRELALRVANDHNDRNTPGPTVTEVVPIPGGWQIRDVASCQRCHREPRRFHTPLADHPGAPPPDVEICGICRLQLQRLLGIHGYARDTLISHSD